MRFKLDENVPNQLGQVLTELGHDHATVFDEGLAGASDADVVSAARSEDRMLVTLDRGFGDIRAYPPGSHLGIFVIRVPDQSALGVVRAVGSFVRGVEVESLRGCVVIVEENRVRVRRPPPA